MAVDESRYHTNSFKDYNGEKLLGEDKKLIGSVAERLKETIGRLLLHFEGVGLCQENTSGRPNFSVYTGTSGYAFLFVHLHNSKRWGDSSDTEDTYLQKALEHLREPLAHPQGRKHTFLCGDAGPLALGAYVYSKLGDERSAAQCISRLESMHINVIRDQTLPDEHLYGRAGYLSALLFVQHHLGMDKVDREVIIKVTKALLDSGQSMAAQQRGCPPLMYEWHEKKYLGAAHGLAGILYTLLLVKYPEVRPQIENTVKACVDYMLTLQYPSGNFPSSVGSIVHDRLVQWCHGAPGWVYMFVTAYKTYNDKKYLQAAEQCCDVVWQRGLLKKGLGLCHGAAGNAYSFLALFRLTQNQKHLYRACKFAEWCCDYGRHQSFTPDHPFSLFEGIAGTIYFLVDMLDPLNARFPAYEY
ncbi:hypothetical protein C0Q70_09727 [Pomacea canaliculata]|uniref:LanC-like protein 2 n=2 Tax=Pomacea canaliculata TaxID=400727 RepID=A0A2T7PAM4_POMCA|nr:hypothetical protein C0Q70_09727 [Pomacea canaliculata]